MHDANAILALCARYNLHFERNGGLGALVQVGLERPEKNRPSGNTLVNTDPAFSPRINLPERESSHVTTPPGSNT